jgi:hypothetical protein
LHTFLISPLRAACSVHLILIFGVNWEWYLSTILIVEETIGWVGWTIDRYLPEMMYPQQVPLPLKCHRRMQQSGLLFVVNPGSSTGETVWEAEVLSIRVLYYISSQKCHRTWREWLLEKQPPTLMNICMYSFMLSSAMDSQVFWPEVREVGWFIYTDPSTSLLEFPVPSPPTDTIVFVDTAVCGIACTPGWCHAILSRLKWCLIALLSCPSSWGE